MLLNQHFLFLFFRYIDCDVCVIYTESQKNGSPQYLGIFAHYIYVKIDLHIYGMAPSQSKRKKVTKVIEFPDNPAYISGKI